MIAAPKTLCLLALSLSLVGCAVGPDYAPAPLPVAQRWQAAAPTTPTSRSTVPSPTTDAAGLHDPVLADLVAQARHASPTLAAAAARLDAARAALRANNAGLWPSASASASASRTRAPDTPALGASTNAGVTTTQRFTGLVAGWELDLFGSVRRGGEAALARAQAMEAQAHAVGITLSAEVASHYVNLRACEVLTREMDLDARSRQNTERLLTLKEKAGFVAPAEVGLARASTAEATARLTAQRADCDLTVKALVELTTLSEPDLRQRLAGAPGQFPDAPISARLDVPAAALAQRPDLRAAERDMAAAAADIGVAQADRYPRLSLTGSIGRSVTRSAGVQVAGGSWSVVPALALPLLDGGHRGAAVEVAQARYHEAQARWHEQALRAVREVEEALVRLDSAQGRMADAAQSVRGYRAYLDAADARVRAGAGSLMELEEARRAVVLAQGVAVNVERERLLAWIALYRAVGGTWASPSAPVSQGPQP